MVLDGRGKKRSEKGEGIWEREWLPLSNEYLSCFALLLTRTQLGPKVFRDAGSLSTAFMRIYLLVNIGIGRRIEC